MAAHVTQLHNYAGTWSSSRYSTGIAHGRAYAQLSPDFTTGEFMITYDGTYRQGAQFLMQVEINRNHAVCSHASYTLNGIAHQQIFAFNADEFTEFAIKGKYETINPGDSGLFSMEQTSDPLPFENKPRQCSIL